MNALFPRGAAVLSPCGLYRYRLERDLGGRGLVIVWVLLNPSTADPDVDDQTLRKVVMFSHRFGGGRVIVVNLYGWRATDPRELAHQVDAVGPDNDRHILAPAAEADRLIVGWGTQRGIAPRAAAVLELLGDRPLLCLGTNADGSPKHPLYLSGLTRPVPYLHEGAAAPAGG